MHSEQIRFVINPEEVVQIVDGPEKMSIILVMNGNEPHAFLNDCPDEHLPLNEEDLPPLINRKGELVCQKHFARFNSCHGCLLHPGQAHHVKRLNDGLMPILIVNEVNELNNSVCLKITEELLNAWRRIKTIRHRKSFGRGPIGTVRFFWARFWMSCSNIAVLK